MRHNWFSKRLAVVAGRIDHYRRKEMQAQLACGNAIECTCSFNATRIYHSAALPTLYSLAII
jgi:hypothetical protein